MNVLVQHIPHAIPVVIIWGIMLRYWQVQRRLERDEVPTAPGASFASRAPSAAVAPVAAPVRRSVAMRGLLALGPLVGALATGLVIYALNLGRGHAGEAAIWTHVGLSLLALLLVAYKIADIGLTRLREGLSGRRALRATGSLLLLALWVPLLVSGVALLIAPSQASFTAYAHLIASVWWAGLFLWHLRRYLSRAVRTVVKPGLSATTSHGLRAQTPTGPARGRRATEVRPGAGRRRQARVRRPASPSRAPGSSEHEPAAAAEEGASAPPRGR